MSSWLGQDLSVETRDMIELHDYIYDEVLNHEFNEQYFLENEMDINEDGFFNTEDDIIGM